MRKNKDGFTLIELMIVIAIIAIIAAIAIPGLLSSQRASNERNASASLKTIASAEADFRGNDRDGMAGATGLDQVGVREFAVSAPKAGYWYRALVDDGSQGGSPQPYATATNGVENTAGDLSMESWWNNSKFGFMAFPDSFSAGRNVFFLNEGNTIFKRTMNGPVKDPTATAPNDDPLTIGANGLVGAQEAETWPADTVLKTEYSKLD
jgi:prepilin-type N-terminal cleavage/methylation domain-containing protein